MGARFFNIPKNMVHQPILYKICRTMCVDWVCFNTNCDYTYLSSGAGQRSATNKHSDSVDTDLAILLSHLLYLSGPHAPLQALHNMQLN